MNDSCQNADERQSVSRNALASGELPKTDDTKAPDASALRLTVTQFLDLKTDSHDLAILMPPPEQPQ
ncbi:MAG: hypothetical protein GXP28_07060 [Planctomycetes bacterium]|nr:hypothetical protein [Planctomycetota bacterium]